MMIFNRLCKFYNSVTDRQMDQPMDQTTNGTTNGPTNGPMDRPTNGPTNRWTYPHKDAIAASRKFAVVFFLCFQKCLNWLSSGCVFGAGK